MNKFITDISASADREKEQRGLVNDPRDNQVKLIVSAVEIQKPPTRTRRTSDNGMFTHSSEEQNPQVAKDREIALQLEKQTKNTRSTRSTAASSSLAMLTYKPPKRKTRNENPIHMEKSKRIKSLSVEADEPDEPEIEIPPPWSGPLLFPFHGPKRTNVDHEDLKRLQKKEFLNDNIINFYLRYLEEQLKAKNPSLADEFHFFNTFFYERLTMKGDKARNLDGVLKWTAKTDLFKKSYVIVPINER